MKRFKLIALMIIIIAAFCTSSSALEKKKDPNVSIGFGASGGYFSGWEREGSNGWGHGWGVGGGFIVEKMFNNRLGIHSGLWYFQTKIPFNMDDSVSPVNVSLYSQTISIPVYLITSLNKKIFSFNILSGFDVAFLFKTKMKSTLINDDNIIRYLSYFQFAVSLGFNFKFRVTTYTTLFFGVIGQFYVTNLYERDRHNNDYSHMFDAKGIVGYMFRTNIFPMPDKN